MPAPTFNQEAESTTSTPAFASNPPAGAAVILACITGATVSAVSGCGATWSQIGTTLLTGGLILNLWLGKNCSGSAKTLAITGTSGTTLSSITSWAGAHTTAPLLAYTIGPAVGGPGPFSMALTPALLSTVVGLYVGDGTSILTWTPTTGMTGLATALTQDANGFLFLNKGYTTSVAPNTAKTASLSWTGTFAPGGVLLALLGAGGAASHASVAMAGGGGGWALTGTNVVVRDPVPLELRVFAAEDPMGPAIAVWPGFTGLRWLDTWNEMGSGILTLALGDPKATDAALAKWNLVRCYLGPFDVFDFWLENLAWTISGTPHVSGPTAEERVQVGGRGLEAYLERAIVWLGGLSYTAQTIGTILRDVITQAQSRGALSLLQFDFSELTDSLNRPWTEPYDSITLDFPEGTSVLQAIGTLRQLGVWIRLRSDFVLQCWFVDPGENLSDTVVLRSGKHLVGVVERTQPYSAAASDILVTAGDGAGWTVGDISGTLPDRFEAYIRGPEGSDVPTLTILGTSEITNRLREGDSISQPILHGMGAGEFEAYRHFGPGDRIGINIPGRLELATELVAAITVESGDGGTVAQTVDLSSKQPVSLAILTQQVGNLARPGA